MEEKSIQNVKQVDKIKKSTKKFLDAGDKIWTIGDILKEKAQRVLLKCVVFGV